MKHKIFNNLFLISSIFLLCSCLSSCKEKPANITAQPFSIQGAFFGSNPGDPILLTNESGSVQIHQQLNELGSYDLKVLADDAKEGTFYLIYAYGKEPKLNPEPPYIQVPLQIKRSLFLPAILVFDFHLAHFYDTEDKDKVFFNWNKPVFSLASENSYLDLIASFEEGFPFKDKVWVRTASFPYEQTHGYADLTSKIYGKKTTLAERFPKDTCKTVNWFLRLHYHYPEGLDLDYTSKKITLNMCK